MRARTTLGAALALGALLLGSGLVIDRLVAGQIRRAADETVLDQATDRAQLLGGGADPASLVTVAGDEVFAVVFDPDGRTLAVAGVSEAGGLAALEPGLHTVVVLLIEDHDNDDADDLEREETNLEQVRAAVAPTPDGARVIVGNEGDGTDATVNTVRLILLLSGPILAAAGAAVAFVVTGQALAPVHRMRSDLAAVTEGGGRVTEPETGDEIQSLAATVNAVLADLEQQSAARRRFVADASHELKSPIANARILLETATNDDRASVQRRLVPELDRLQALVDDLLFLARTDEATPPNAASFDLDDVLFDEAERAALRTEAIVDAGKVIPARVLADRTEVARAVRNLLENAARHARSRVSVAVTRAEAEGGRAGVGPGWLVTIDDDGPGVAPEHRAQIFDRFVRLDDDRTRMEGGTGLGLSIVASIAARNGGGVAVEAAPGGGARFLLQLPAVD
ncbi:MAG: HAMP domain-containing sensor histidine kinase [Actinomycetota bacterium]